MAIPCGLPRRLQWRTPCAAAVASILLVHGLVAEGQRPVPPTDDRTVAHVLNRLTFGARPGDVQRVTAMGVPAFVERQLHPERIDDRALEARLAAFETVTMSARELADTYFVPALTARRQQLRQQPPAAGSTSNGAPGAEPRGTRTPEMRMTQAGPARVLSELMQAKVLRAALSERQLQEVLVDFWFNHFNVFIGKGHVRQYVGAYEREAIRPHVLGRFRDLLGAVAHSPAMLFYLDNWQSAAPNRRVAPGNRQPAVRQARGLNENYARELMELHTLGVDGGYAETDVVELARILTGWTIDRPMLGGAFVFRPEMHDTGSKTLLGTSFAASGESEGERALDLLARHPSTARHISYKLAQRFVADEPPAALVERAARVFQDSKGNLRDVVRAIVSSPEFFAAGTHRAKVKTPLEFVASAIRATGATIVTAQPLVAALRNLGMPLYGCQPPTGYSMTADAWVNTGALLNRMNFAVALVDGGRITNDELGLGGRAAGAPRPAPGPGRRGRGSLANDPVRVDVDSLAPDTGPSSHAAVVSQLLAGEVSDTTRATLARADTPKHLVALAIGSPEFQRR